MIPLVTLWSFLATFFSFQNDFLADQKKYPRVRSAFTAKEQLVKQNLTTYGLDSDNMQLLIMAYKDESQLEIYAKSYSAHQYTKISTYKICAKSGKPGPKRRQGDYQVPEGLYHIDRFNPASNFHLSLGINYPNQADRKRSTSNDPGGDIFIHGNCVTVGCLPMTDDFIQEIYLYALLAKAGGQQRIPVYIFPFKMNDENFKSFKEKYSANEELMAFWTNLKQGYDHFKSQKKALRFSIDNGGHYIF